MGTNNINCPECGKVFKIEESGYLNILNQVRNDEFEHEFDWINNEHDFEKGYLDYKSKLKYLNTFAKNYFPYNYNTYFLNSQDKDIYYYHEQNITLVKKIVMLLDDKKRFEKVIDFYDK